MIILAVGLIFLDIIMKQAFYTILLIYGLFIRILFSDRIKDQLRRVLAILIWSVFIGAFGLVYYVNHYLPHGPRYPTGDIVCQNDGRGPCGETYIEDTRGLAIPGWAKLLRSSKGEVIVFGILFAGVVIIKDKDEN